MTRALLVVGWVCFALDAFVVVGMFVSRNMGDDAAGRGMARGYALLLAPVLLIAGILLVQGQRVGSRWAILAGTLIVALPFLLFAWNLFTDAGSGLARTISRSREGKYADARLTAIARAIDAGDPAAAAAAIRGPKLDFAARERNGSTILGYAVKRALAWNAPPKRMPIVRLVLEAGAPVVDGVEAEGVPLVANVADNADPRTVELLDMLLAHGGDPNATLPFDPEPLVFSVNLTLDKARVLVRHGADLKALAKSGGREGWTPLMFAAERGDWDVALFLLESGAPAELAGKDGSTARSIAEGAARQERESGASGTPSEYDRLVAALGTASK
jgi:hypothetical protein